MPLKIEPVSVEELESEFGTSSSGNDPETVSYLRELKIGEGFKVSADAGETDRMVKRRINACAKEAFRELDWRVGANGGLSARVKAIDTAAEAEWLEANKPQDEPQTPSDSPEVSPEVETPNGAPGGSEEPAKRSNRREPASVA